MKNDPEIKEIVFSSSGHTFAHMDDAEVCEGGHHGMDLLLCQEYVQLLNMEFTDIKLGPMPEGKCCICYFGG